ncbi:MAG: flagellar biosynthetic protein FliR [Gammaproteobacteria bacterium]
MTITSEALTTFITSYLWPLFRIGALIIVAPIFGTHSVPRNVKMGFAVILTLAIVPVLPPAPIIDPLSADGLLITIHQVVIGLSMGFMIKMVFSALETGGHVVGQTMGLGFAQMVDPASGVAVPVMSQFYTVMATLVFLALNGHLILIEVLVESFHTMPIAAASMPVDGIWSLVSWASWIFSGAVIIALPAVSALLLVNLAFGVMMRAAPQLNVFAIGFPLSLTLGFVFIFVTLPIFLPQFTDLLDSAFATVKNLITIR